MSFRSFDLFNLVKDFGESLTLRKEFTGGTYNPETGTLDNETAKTYKVTGYFYNYSEGILFNVDQIRRGTRKCVISAIGLTVEPEDGDELVGTQDKVKIISVRTIFSAGTKICYVCDVRE